MRILVTGGAGRLGRTVVAELAGRDHEVVAVDRQPAAGMAAPAGEAVVADLTEPGVIPDLLGRIRPEAVIHLAAIPAPFVRPDAETYRVNTSLAFEVCVAAVAAGVRSVVLASSPTVIGYGDPGWAPAYLPLDEAHPVAPWHAYALSKVATEQIVELFARRAGDSRFAAFRPCYVIAPEEWDGAPTQAGHTVRQRLDDPALAAVSLFNYCDARDVASFLDRLSTVLNDGGATAEAANGRTFFVGAADALARRPLSELLPRHHPATGPFAAPLGGSAPAFSIESARRLLEWTPSRSWRTELT
jgi:nucleoside-diphosphate-sugar epimerase